MSTTWSSRLHVTLPIEQSTQTRPLESQTRMNILPRVLCLLGLNVSLYLARVSLQDATSAAALWSGVFPSHHFCLHPAFCSNSPFAILALPNFLQCLLDLNSSLRLKVHISTGDLLSLKALPKLVPSRMFFFLTSLGKPLMYVIHAQHFVFLYGTSSQSSVRRPPLTKQWASWKYSLYNFPSLRHPSRVR